MLHRRVLAIVAATALALSLAAPAAADTGGPNGNEDRVELGATWADGDTTYFASVTLVNDHYNHTSLVALSIFWSESITCDNGTPEDTSDDTSGILNHQFYGEGTPSSISFGRKLATAQGSGTVTGSQIDFDECLGTETESPAVYTAGVTATATGAPVTTSIREVTSGPGKSKTTFTQTATRREATGSLQVNGASHPSSEPGQISHTEWKTVVK